MDTKIPIIRNWQRGDLVVLNGLLAVVVGIPGDPNVPEDHIAIWYGEPQDQRLSKESPGQEKPKVYTVPAEYCYPGPEPLYLH